MHLCTHIHTQYTKKKQDPGVAVLKLGFFFNAKKGQLWHLQN